MQDLTTMTVDQKLLKSKIYSHTYRASRNTEKAIVVIVYGTELKTLIQMQQRDNAITNLNNMQIKKEINELQINYLNLIMSTYLWFNCHNLLHAALANNLICKKAEQAVIRFTPW